MVTTPEQGVPGLYVKSDGLAAGKDRGKKSPSGPGRAYSGIAFGWISGRKTLAGQMARGGTGEDADGPVPRQA